MSERQNPVQVSQNGQTNVLLNRVKYSPSAYQRLKQKAWRLRKRGFKKNAKPYLLWKQEDWKALRTEFFNKTKKDGSYFYANARNFVRAKWPQSYVQTVMLWVIGPKPTKKVPWEGDWALERFAKAWRADARTQALAVEIRKELQAIEIGKDVADVFVDYLGRFLVVQTKVDEMYGETITLEGLKPEENRRRIKDYLNLSSAVMDRIRFAVESMVEAFGGKKMLVLQMLEKTMTRRTEAVLAANGNKTEDQEVETIVGRLVQVAMERSKIFGTKLPGLDELELEIKEDEEPSQRKQHVQ